MPIPLTQYAKIKNRYCICYFGPCDEYIVQLLYLRPFIEKALPGLEIHIGCRNGLDYLLNTHARITNKSQINKRHYAHIKELKCDMKVHPVYQMLVDSNLTDMEVHKAISGDHTRRCIISTKGKLPTKSLTPQQIEYLKQKYKLKGYEVCIDEHGSNGGIVIGVESMVLFQAACNGIRTALVPTGLGTDIYKMIAKDGDIINIPAK